MLAATCRSGSDFLKVTIPAKLMCRPRSTSSAACSAVPVKECMIPGSGASAAVSRINWTISPEATVVGRCRVFLRGDGPQTAAAVPGPVRYVDGTTGAGHRGVQNPSNGPNRFRRWRQHASCRLRSTICFQSASPAFPQWLGWMPVRDPDVRKTLRQGRPIVDWIPLSCRWRPCGGRSLSRLAPPRMAPGHQTPRRPSGHGCQKSTSRIPIVETGLHSAEIRVRLSSTRPPEVIGRRR